MFGQWQRLLLLELDEPKDRDVVFHVFGGSARERQPSVHWMQRCSPNAERRARSGWAGSRSGATPPSASSR